jgi:hypothetical protein
MSSNRTDAHHQIGILARKITRNPFFDFVLLFLLRIVAKVTPVALIAILMGLAQTFWVGVEVGGWRMGVLGSYTPSLQVGSECTSYAGGLTDR